MAEAFNLNTFLNSYQQTTYDPTKQHANAEKNMENKLVKQAENAVHVNLLSLTLSEKIAELGVGERVLQQFADTAKNLVLDIDLNNENLSATTPQLNFHWTNKKSE